ncbi:MAG: TonB-dependent receptor [Rhodospirillales bacterium]|nr:TonB-dependent receptor [Rhodospirillales bacterium]
MFTRHVRAAAVAACFASSAFIPSNASADAASGDRAERRAALLRQLATVQAELDALDKVDPPATPRRAQPASPAAKVAGVEEIVVTGSATSAPIAQPATTITRDRIERTPAFSIGEVLKLSPGVTVVQGNGPRDVSVSVRGSNARNTFGIRNVVVSEDGFPVTQPDGLARTDLTDPHAYGAIDILRGPSSARFGNYATGGAIDFRTRSGREIDGAEVSFDAGSFGYLNGFATVGGGDARYDYSLFASHVRADGSTQHTGFNTSTVNLLASYALTPSDRLTFKLIDNEIDANLSLRLSLAQYQANPFQRGCEQAAAAGCGTVSLFTNGFNGARQNFSADQAALGRNDRRTIVGARWDHAFDGDTTLRTQLTFDNRDVKQPTSSTSFVGTFPSFNLSSELTRKAELLGRAATLRATAFGNYENVNSVLYNQTPAGSSVPGALTQNVTGRHANYGARLNGEIEIAPRWTAVLGVGVERTELNALQTAYAYPVAATPTLTLIRADRSFMNVAPEAGLRFAATNALTLRARVAGGYGTPQLTNLFVTQQGTPGNNTQLDTHTNLGVDVGATLKLDRTLTLDVTGFYEFFRNELVTQSAGANLQSFTFNAPRSEHRGVELALDWQPLPSLLPGARLNLAYLYDDQRYTSYAEQLSAGSLSTTFDRSGKHIPGVMPNALTTRLSYDQPDGPARGLGAYVEFDFRDAYAIDNANLLRVPSARLINLGLSYEPRDAACWLARARFYVAVQNVLDATYVGSTGNVTNSISPTSGAQNGLSTLATTTGSIYAGTPRSVFGGVRVKF